MKVMKSMSKCYDDLISVDYNDEHLRSTAHAFMVQILEEIVDSKNAEMHIEDESGEMDISDNGEDINTHVWMLAKRIYNGAVAKADKINNEVFKSVKRDIKKTEWSSNGVLEDSILTELNYDVSEWVATRGGNPSSCVAWKSVSGYECIVDLEEDMLNDDLMDIMAARFERIIIDEVLWLVDSGDEEESDDESDDEEDIESDEEETEESSGDENSDSDRDSDSDSDSDDLDDISGDNDDDITRDLNKNEVFKDMHCTVASRQARYLNRVLCVEKMT